MLGVYWFLRFFVKFFCYTYDLIFIVCESFSIAIYLFSVGTYITFSILFNSSRLLFFLLFMFIVSILVSFLLCRYTIGVCLVCSDVVLSTAYGFTCQRYVFFYSIRSCLVLIILARTSLFSVWVEDLLITLTSAFLVRLDWSKSTLYLLSCWKINPWYVTYVLM